MSWLMILIEAVVFLGLFTAMVMIPAIKNPVLGGTTIPLKFRRRISKPTHELRPRLSASARFS